MDGWRVHVCMQISDYIIYKYRRRVFRETLA